MYFWLLVILSHRRAPRTRPAGTDPTSRIKPADPDRRHITANMWPCPWSLSWAYTYGNPSLPSFIVVVPPPPLSAFTLALIRFPRIRPDRWVIILWHERDTWYAWSKLPSFPILCGTGKTQEGVREGDRETWKGIWCRLSFFPLNETLAWLASTCAPCWSICAQATLSLSLSLSFVLCSLRNRSRERERRRESNPRLLN